MLTILVILCLTPAAAALGVWLGFKGANAQLRRDFQTLRDDHDHLAGRMEREVKIRAANRSVEVRQDHLKEAAQIVEATKAANHQPPHLWGRVQR